MLSDKNKLLDLLEENIEQQINTAIMHFQNLNSDRLLKNPPNGGWSIAQCLEHLNSYGRYYLPAIENGLRQQHANDIETKIKSSWLGRYFTKLMNPKTSTRKFKAFKAHVPSENLNAHEVVAEFIQQQELFFKYIQDARKKNLNTVHIPISILKIIRLNINEVFHFLIAHNERHIRQAERNLLLIKTDTNAN
jgi:hypothetical protein